MLKFLFTNSRMFYLGRLSQFLFTHKTPLLVDDFYCKLSRPHDAMSLEFAWLEGSSLRRGGWWSWGWWSTNLPAWQCCCYTCVCHMITCALVQYKRQWKTLVLSRYVMYSMWLNLFNASLAELFWFRKSADSWSNVAIFISSTGKINWNQHYWLNVAKNRVQ